MNRISTRNKLLIILGAILLFSFTGISYLNYKVTRASVREEILRNDLPLTMENIYSELTSELTRPLLVSSSMASDTFLKDWSTEGEKDVNKIIKYLAQIRNKYGFFTTFFVSASSGNYYRYNGTHKQISRDDSHDVWFFDFIESEKEYLFDVDTDEGAGNILTIFMNYRVIDSEGSLLGVTGVGLKVDTVSRLISEYRQKYDRAVYLTDPEGIIQVHPDTSFVDKKRIHELQGISEIAEVVLAEKGQGKNYEFTRNEERILLTVKYMESLGWLLYVEQNESKSLVTAKKNFIRTITVGLVASVVIIILTLFTINRYQDRIEMYAVIDELTGISNRRALDPEFKRMLYSFSRTGRKFCVLLLDLDKFKKVNDFHGHMVGDTFLVDVVQVISKVVRGSDVLVRWGGDEFVIISEGDKNNAMRVADRIRQSVRLHDFVGEGASLRDPRNLVTVSCGIAGYREGDDLDSMLLRADQAMYRCKGNGGNAVEFGA
jgi:diguanylate cyclase (GGDEF)-like protein